MNEIKKIHLGRQPFTISVEAHRTLRAYLDAIQHQVGGKGDVLKEVEFRMAELLNERGIVGEKVVLSEDIEFLKEQLGTPADFKDEATDNHSTDDTEDGEEGGPIKRLYRDPENAMIAGVSSGLAAYFRIDPLIVRLVFVVLTFAGFTGILMYILLWILVPEATSPSERLQMRGKAVTVDNIKRFVDRADVPAAAGKVSRTSVRIAVTLAKAFRILLGIFITILGSVLFTAVMIAGAYAFIHGVQVNAVTVFPTNAQEVIGGIGALVAGIIGSLGLITIGTTITRKKWVLPSWLTALLIGLGLISVSVATAVGFKAIPDIRERYRYSPVTFTQSVAPFDKLQVVGNDTNLYYRQSEEYKVEVFYAGPWNISDYINKRVDGNTLVINTQKYSSSIVCDIFCFTEPTTLNVIIHAPKLEDINLKGDMVVFDTRELRNDQNVALEVDQGAQANIRDVEIRKARIVTQSIGDVSPSSDKYRIELEGIVKAQYEHTQALSVTADYSVTLPKIQTVDVAIADTEQCSQGSPRVILSDRPAELVLNGTTIESLEKLRRMQNDQETSFYNCIAPPKIVQR